MFSSSQVKDFNQFLKIKVTKKLCPGFDRHSVFLTNQGHVYTRGLNNNGQLGRGDTKTSGLTFAIFLRKSSFSLILL